MNPTWLLVQTLGDDLKDYCKRRIDTMGQITDEGVAALVGGTENVQWTLGDAAVTLEGRFNADQLIALGLHMIKSNSDKRAAEDTRFVYGANCTWAGPIQNVGRRESGLPCCPHCGSSLFELPSRSRWDEGVAAFDKEHPGYADLMKWGEGRCFPNREILLAAYTAETGVIFTLPEGQ